jgi:hypothetical protein
MRQTTGESRHDQRALRRPAATEYCNSHWPAIISLPLPQFAHSFLKDSVMEPNSNDAGFITCQTLQEWIASGAEPTQNTPEYCNVHGLLLSKKLFL